MKIFALILVSALTTYADENSKIQCVGQIMSSVYSVHIGKGENFKKFVFSKKVDKQLTKLHSELEEAMKKENTDQNVKNVKSVFDRATPIIEKSAASDLKSCSEFIQALSAETHRICPNFGKPTMDESEIKKCNDKALEKKEIKAKYDVWMKFMDKVAALVSG